MHSEKVYLGDTEIDLDTQIEIAEHGLVVAINHLNDLLAKRNARDADLDAWADAEYEKYLDIEAGRLMIESDRADKEIARDVAIKYMEKNPDAWTKVVPTDGNPFAFGDLVLVDKIDGTDMEIGKISSKDDRECPEVSDDIPF